MKSRRELISGLCVDVAKVIFVSIATGKVVSPDVISWAVATIAVDKGWKLWR